jgi:hypothetical protein
MAGIVYFALVAVASSYGFGKHAATLSPGDIQQANKYLIISFEPGILLFSVPKFAVVILLVKILHPGRVHLVILWAVSIVYGILLVGQLVINLAQCTPVAAQWGAVEGHCWDRSVTINFSIAFAGISAVFDLYLALYPTIVMCLLMLNWRKKLALSSALGFGYWWATVPAWKPPARVLTVPPDQCRGHCGVQGLPAQCAHAVAARLYIRGRQRGALDQVSGPGCDSERETC